MNPGFSKEEIEKLKAECAEEGQSFVLVEDEEDFDDSGDFAHFQFIGQYEGKEVIYDAIMSTLSLHHNALVFDYAEQKVQAAFKDYIPLEDRTDVSKINEEAEEMLEEIMEELEEEETIKVAEFVDVDPEFEFGVGLEIALNLTEITIEDIETFIEEFNAGTISLDKTMYSFKNDFED
jgi:hypothetical protein